MNAPHQFPSSGRRRLSRAQSGAALLMLAIALGWTPWFSGPSLLWSAVLMLAGAAIFSGRLPHAARQRLKPLLALIVVAHAFHWWHLGLGWLPWLMAAVLLTSEEWQRLDATALRSGYRLYVPLGVAVALLAMLATWDQTPGYSTFSWMGGFQMQSHYNYANRMIEMRSVYNPTLYPNNFFWPGFEYSGRALSGAIWAEIGLLGLVAWAAWRDQTAGFNGRLLPIVAVALIALWALPAAKSTYAAPHWFLLGLALAGFGVWKSAFGPNRGAFDPHDVAQRLHNRMS